MVVAWTGCVAPGQKRASGARPTREPWHPSNSPLRKIQECNHSQGKGTYPSGGSESCCSGASKQFPICFRLLGRRSQLAPLRCEVWAGLYLVLYWEYSVSLSSLSPQLRRHRPCAFSLHRGQYRTRQQRLRMRIRYASFALTNCRISHLVTLGDLHTHTRILTFYRSSYILSSRMHCSQTKTAQHLYETWPCVPGDRRSHPWGHNLFPVASH